MKKWIFLFLILAVDAICPDVVNGAQVTIAPLVIGAIISAVGSLAAAEAQKQGQTNAANAAASSKDKGGGIDMKPVFEDAAKQVGESLSVQQNPNVTRMNGEIAEANNPVLAQGSIANPSPVKATPLESTGPEGGFKPVPQDPMLPEAEIVPPGTKLPGESAGMSTKEKMAMAASIGSLLRGPGAPAPPSRGGRGIEMSPVFQNVTMRDLARG